MPTRHCERCGAPTPSRRYRCSICQRLVCSSCSERIDEARRVWRRSRDSLGQLLPKDCTMPTPLDHFWIGNARLQHCTRSGCTWHRTWCAVKRRWLYHPTKDGKLRKNPGNCASSPPARTDSPATPLAPPSNPSQHHPGSPTDS